MNDQVWSITQGKQDRMYFATSDGMASFNGSDWQIPEVSRQNIIRTVAADEDGRIYMGSYDEFGYWQRDNFDRLFYTSLLENTQAEINNKEEIWHILLTPQNVYFQSFSSIYSYDKKEVKKIRSPGNIMFLQAVRDQLFLQQIDGGIFELRDSNNFQLLDGTDFFSDKKVVFILPFEKTGLLVGTEKHGIFIWEKNIVKQWNTPLQGDFLKNQLNKGLQLSSGDYAFGTIINGIYILDAQGNLKTHLTKQTGLPDNTVLSMTESNDGNLWVGLDKGIVLIDIKNPLLFYKDVEGDIGTVYTASLFEEHLYLGTNHGVFYKKENAHKNGISNSGFQFLEGTQGQVWDLRKAGDQLLCGHNEGTFSISKNKVEKISINNGGWSITSLFDNENVLLQGTYSGVVVFKKNNLGRWIYSHRVNDFSEPIKEIVVDEEGGIWLAHPIEGLRRIFLDSTQSEITNNYKFSEADGLPSDKMINLLKSEGQIFVKSGKRWFRFNKKTNQFTNTGKIKNQEIGKLEGKIILGENDTWFELLPRQVNYFLKNKTGILPLSLKAGYGNTIHLIDGQYLFCLDNGYALLKSEKLQQDSSEKFPPIIINRIEIVEEDSISMISLMKNDLELDNHQNRLWFHFYQPYFSSPPSFRYRLLGAENNWSTWSEKSEKEYFNLSAGKYTFQVESKFGHQSSAINFEILPHWTQSWWAYFLYFLGFMMLIGLFQIFQKRKFETAKRKMQMDQERLLLEQQMRADNEKLHIDIVNKSKQLANSTMNLVQKNEILLQIKNELLQLKKKSDVQIPGKYYQQLLHIIDLHLTSDQDWELFEKNFNQVHELFLKKLKTEFPELTPGDLQLSAYLKMNLSSKEIAPLLHISIRGIENKRYRLRKKLGLSKDGNLTEFLMKY